MSSDQLIIFTQQLLGNSGLGCECHYSLTNAFSGTWGQGLTW